MRVMEVFLVDFAMMMEISGVLGVIVNLPGTLVLTN